MAIPPHILKVIREARQSEQSSDPGRLEREYARHMMLQRIVDGLVKGGAEHLVQRQPKTVK